MYAPLFERPMKGRIFITALVLASLHLVPAFGSFVVAYGSAMESFDDPDHQTSRIERIAGPVAKILSQPGISLWTSSMSKNLPDVVEWGVYTLNSLLWGVVLSLLLNGPATGRRLPLGSCDGTKS